MCLYRISFSLLLCLSFSALFGQVNLNGKIFDPVDTLVTLTIPPTSLGDESRSTSTRLSTGNEFRLTIQTEIATPAVLSHGDFSIPIFLVPNQSFSLQFTADYKEANHVLFAGPGGANNTFFHEYLKFLEEKSPSIDSNLLARSNAREYRRLMDQNRAARETYLETWPRSTGIEVAPVLLRWLRDDIKYTYATELLRYPSVFQNLHDGTKKRTPAADYYSFLQNIQINNPKAIVQDSYQRFLESFFIYKLEKPMDWGLRTDGQRQYSFLSRFFFGPPLYYMQYLVFERTSKWLVEPNYMAQEYESLMASKAPALLKQKLEQIRKNPPKIYSMQSFSIIDGPVLSEVFQFHDGKRPDTSFFKGRPSLLYFHDRRLSRVDFVINYLKKLRQNLMPDRNINLCLVDVNGDFEEWQSLHFNNEYANHSITHLSMNYFDDHFDPTIEQGIFPNIVIADANGSIVEKLNWKPPIKQILEIINRIP